MTGVSALNNLRKSPEIICGLTASLPTENITVGDVYNVTDAFTASDAFVANEAGKEYPAGTNVCYTANGWDAMAGTYDFSNFVMKDDIADITAEEIAEICKLPKA